jgi:hypothetical protein
MNDKPETPSEGMDEARAETPRAEGTPSIDAGNIYSPPPPSSPAGWQPGQYNSGAAGTTDLSGGTPPMPTPPPYSQAPAQPPPQYGYTPPQGQPTQYMPPPQSQYGPPPSYPAAGPPTVSTPGQPPNYQPGNYGGGYPQYPQQPVGYGTVQPKDPTVGLLLELLGYVGFLVIVHIWAGKTTRGIALMVGFWIYLIMSWALTILLVGCLMLVAGLAVPIASGLYLKSEMEREQAAMGIRR